MNYRKFFLMMFFSFILMYIMMFLNVNAAEDYYTSLTRIYMALMMVAPMAILMIMMMGRMYPDRKKNSMIIIISALVFIASFTALRLQLAVGDAQYLRAMIPHHSSAIMTSRHAGIKDPEVRALADSIIKSQQREIDQMNRILKRLP
ncbi:MULTISPECIES: DUF305 domain-containing protein [Chryseobacterium]|uniref:Uncharacterized protein (DUF305 family) n=1 Tax=Chryseobacterium camelliae TaxID=1265445 RepID=A0ABU0TIR3_9FLAO|nr:MULTISPECIES: DUF305 domain-containing protein [Chryseobacterium]MDT3409429.1 uncharacterized protein (DUF305 family) [Pseudacidovorax intermedius]MDQ1096706.1 uncharacterized protein (DUF305 family) [Chryseobacterium camelliae]MDQ1100650.1 uncharacterized protein (DUF305 family) [Chryseobacterium sp. SORGH_AS_1048]MDR6087988.1 uncharacterized protein (DUF305 family) [Chryseobacterium sp. SORGH_AS_0909]MDR6132363.1 uncharacterized protein (DUF305 family) [Chryseobacterium sp. SORGH_AS_1175]